MTPLARLRAVLSRPTGLTIGQLVLSLVITMLAVLVLAGLWGVAPW